MSDKKHGLDVLAAAAAESETVYETPVVSPEASTPVTYPNVHAYITHLGTLGADAIVEAKVVADELTKILTRPAGNAGNSERRGQLQGLTLEKMTDEQLKREKINSDSVLYKAIQRGAAAETIAKNQARVDAVKAEKAKRTPEVAPVAEATPVTAEQAATEAAITAEV